MGRNDHQINEPKETGRDETAGKIEQQSDRRPVAPPTNPQTETPKKEVT